MYIAVLTTLIYGVVLSLLKVGGGILDGPMVCNDMFVVDDFSSFDEEYNDRCVVNT